MLTQFSTFPSSPALVAKDGQATHQQVPAGLPAAPHNKDGHQVHLAALATHTRVASMLSRWHTVAKNQNNVPNSRHLALNLMKWTSMTTD